MGPTSFNITRFDNSCILPLNPTLDAFDDFISKFNLQQIDTYNQCSFEDLMYKNQKMNIPYFIALIEDNTGAINPVDGASFAQQHLGEKNESHSTDDHEIVEVKIYQIDYSNRAFIPFCSLSDLNENNGHFIKWINACNYHLNPDLRGPERFYVATSFDINTRNAQEADKQQAIMWYKRSAEDEYFGAYLVLSLLDAIEHPKQSLEYLENAVRLCPTTHPAYKALQANYQKKLAAFHQYNL